jgi:tRNA threonylcarbamoyladenosine biosynthesis protein TsaE
MEIISTSVKQTQGIARRLAKSLKLGDVVALAGNLGSGKTVFVGGLAAGLGYFGAEVVSPTFVLMRRYQGKLPLNHFDLYRLKALRQLEQIGYEEYFYSDAVTVIEWADRIPDALPREYLCLEFKILTKNKRLLKFTPIGERYENYLRELQEKKIKLSQRYTANPEQDP